MGNVNRFFTIIMVSMYIAGWLMAIYALIDTLGNYGWITMVQ